MHITSRDFQRKMHGRSLTESIWFKVTSGINVSRVKKKLGSIFFSRFRHVEWTMRLWRPVTWGGKLKWWRIMWEIMILLSYEYVILVPLMPLNRWIYINCCHAEDLGCFPWFLCVMWSLKAWFWGFMSKYEFYILDWWMFAWACIVRLSVQNIDRTILFAYPFA